jgi:hypothetical protein
MKNIYTSFLFLILGYVSVFAQVIIKVDGDSVTIRDSKIETACESRLSIHASLISDTINVIEKDTISSANCFCDYSLAASLHGLSVGTYHVILIRYDYQYHGPWVNHYWDSTKYSLKDTTINVLTSSAQVLHIKYSFRNCHSLIESVTEERPLPITYASVSNYPNPFNPATVIHYTISNTSHITLSIFNIKGELVTELVNEIKDAGSYDINYNAKNLASGVYICRLKAGNQIASSKMIILK